MKAIIQSRYGERDVLEQADIPIPQTGENDVLIEVYAAAVNPVDWKIRKGWLTSLLQYEFPLILGWDVSGVVSQVGSKVTAFKAGDKVFSRPEIERNGAYADYIAVNQACVAQKPGNLSFEEAAAVPLVGLTAHQALVNAARVKKGQKVLIHGGAGGIGSIAIQIAKNEGCFVATTCSGRNADFVRDLGADVVIDYEKDDFSTMLSDYDVVFNTLDNDIILKSYDVLRPGGILVTIYGPKGIEIPMNETAKQKKIHAEHVFTDPSGAELAKLGTLLEKGTIKPVVGNVFPLTLEGVRKAHELSETEHIRGKIVLKNK